MLEATPPGLQRKTLTPLLFLEVTAFRRLLGPVPCRGPLLCGSLVPVLKLTKFFSGPKSLLLSQLRSLLALKCLALCAFLKVQVSGSAFLSPSSSQQALVPLLPSLRKQGVVALSFSSVKA